MALASASQSEGALVAGCGCKLPVEVILGSVVRCRLCARFSTSFARGKRRRVTCRTRLMADGRCCRQR
eukprot:6769566-Prymnesium_polylepis.1